VIARADPDTVAAFRFNAASSRVQDLAPWPAGPINALGDAVHATPPTAGMGAGAAIRDAASLVKHLREVAADTTTLTVAISQFEADVRLRGSEVLTLAMKTVRWILATDTRLGAAAMAAATPILAAANRLKDIGDTAVEPVPWPQRPEPRPDLNPPSRSANARISRPAPAEGGSSDSDEYRLGSMGAGHSPVESGDGRLSGDSPVAMKTVRWPTWTAWSANRS
jgi:hypothetical protein